LGALNKFKAKDRSILIATDVASRYVNCGLLLVHLTGQLCIDCHCWSVCHPSVVHPMV